MHPLDKHPRASHGAAPRMAIRARRSATLSCVLFFSPLAAADCTSVTTPATTQYTCSSGTSGFGLTDLIGNNTLVFPASGTGTINGPVRFGPGNDLILMDSGRILGAVDQGDGANVMRIGAGMVNGDVQQGNGIDTFQMSGGLVQSVAQGDGRDVLQMTGGTIVGGFDDGDVATMTGGTLGRANMKLDNNIFDLSGGQIVGNLVTGLGRDTIIVSGGSIGGNISVSGADDEVTVSGGVVDGEIRTSFGNDRFTWDTAGVIRSAILMGDGDDSARLNGLDESRLTPTPSLDGGIGLDTLTLNATTSSTAARYIGWEAINLTNASRLDLTGDLFLGDSLSGAGTLALDDSSAMTVTQGAVRPYNAGQLATVSNAGRIDMSSASATATDALTVYGNYVGNNGALLLQTELGDDASPSDKLIVSQGAISGSTRLGVTNLGGLGGLTRQNGIEVVQASNGATSADGAFALSGALSAGAYRYYLFKGGVTAGSENNWYLRSSVVAGRALAAAPQPPVVAPPVVTPPVITPPPVTPPITPPVTEPITEPEGAEEPPVEPATATPVVTPEPPANTPGQEPSQTPSPEIAQASPLAALGTPALPTPIAGAQPIPLYRVEVPVWSVVIPGAHLMMLSALGTFHDRQGEQSLLTETGAVPAGWGRVYNNDLRKRWSGTVSPRFDGSVDGYQVGHDLYASDIGEGRVQRLGFFVGHSQLQGGVKGFADGFQGTKAGRTKLAGYSVGAYWTLTDDSGGYVDAVVMGTRLEGKSRSERGITLDADGHGLTVSVEGGYPIKVSDRWEVEPQVQVIHQRIELDDQNDGISTVAFDAQAYTTGRVGARLKGRYAFGNTPLEPYLRANLWHTFDGKDTVTYDGIDRIKSEHRSSSADIGLGVMAKLSPRVAIYLSADYNTHLDSQAMEGMQGSLGLRMSW